MATASVIEFLDRQIVQSNPLATVMQDCLVLREPGRQSSTILAIARLSRVRRIRTTHPALLVVAVALFVIASGAYFSKDGGGAVWPLALLGGTFTAGYFLTRRGSVAFIVGAEYFETGYGSLSEAARVVEAVHSAQARLESDS